MDSQAKSYGGREKDRKAETQTRIDGSRNKSESSLIYNGIVNMNACRILAITYNRTKKKVGDEFPPLLHETMVTPDTELTKRTAVRVRPTLPRSSANLHQSEACSPLAAISCQTWRSVLLLTSNSTSVGLVSGPQGTTSSSGSSQLLSSETGGNAPPVRASLWRKQHKYWASLC